MNCVVIYKSKYTGAVRRYAEYIADRLFCRAVDVTQASDKDIEESDIVIYGGGIYAGAVAGSAFLNNHKASLGEKKLIFFTCGMTDPENYGYFNAIALRNVPAGLRRNCFDFHFYGALDYSKLKFMDKMIIDFMVSSIKHKPREKLDEREKRLLELKKRPIDLVDLKSAEPLIWRAQNINAPRPGFDDDDEDDDLYAD